MRRGFLLLIGAGAPHRSQAQTLEEQLLHAFQPPAINMHKRVVPLGSDLGNTCAAVSPSQQIKRLSQAPVPGSLVKEKVVTRRTIGWEISHRLGIHCQHDNGNLRKGSTDLHPATCSDTFKQNFKWYQVAALETGLPQLFPQLLLDTRTY